MSHHVGIRVVHHCDVEAVFFDCPNELRRDLSGRHLGLRVVGGYLRRVDEDPCLAFERLFPAAVEKVRDMRVLLRLGNAELAQTRACNGFAQGVFGGYGRKQRLGKPFQMTGARCQGNARDVPETLNREGVKPGIDQGRYELPDPVSAEIRQQQRIAVPHAAVPIDDRRLDEFIADLSVRGRLKRGLSCGMGVPDPAGNGLPGTFCPVPAMVPVHRPVAAGYGGDRGPGDPPDRLSECPEMFGSTVGRHVPAVEKCMQADGHAAPRDDLAQGGDMGLVRVDSTWGEQTQNMACAF